MSDKRKVLFLCTGNSCRSQMAEGIARKLYSEKISIYSAGIEKHGMNPYAMKVMEEMGIDISGQSSKTLDETGVDFDCVVTVCDHANESCPEFSGKTQVIHFPFPDPPKLAKDKNSEEDKLTCYRSVRDEIYEKMDSILEPVL
ncbi:MAG: arsenate reductase ArsC [Lentisphaeraceae bacterium]|nr:arsenate reductase ArsC [Lentisphaeraceae bacterium]